MDYMYLSLIRQDLRSAPRCNAAIRVCSRRLFQSVPHNLFVFGVSTEVLSIFQSVCERRLGPQLLVVQVHVLSSFHGTREREPCNHDEVRCSRARKRASSPWDAPLFDLDVRSIRSKSASSFACFSLFVASSPCLIVSLRE